METIHTKKGIKHGLSNKKGSLGKESLFLSLFIGNMHQEMNLLIPADVVGITAMGTNTLMDTDLIAVGELPEEVHFDFRDLLTQDVFRIEGVETPVHVFYIIGMSGDV